METQDSMIVIIPDLFNILEGEIPWQHYLSDWIRGEDLDCRYRIFVKLNKPEAVLKWLVLVQTSFGSMIPISSGSGKKKIFKKYMKDFKVMFSKECGGAIMPMTVTELKGLKTADEIHKAVLDDYDLDFIKKAKEESSKPEGNADDKSK